MAELDINLIKKLRDETGYGVMDVKQAFQDADGDMKKAKELLDAKSAMVVEKKSGRETKSGLVETYTHLGKIGAMVEVNSETDFVARNDDFKQFVHDLALQVASMNPVDIDELMAQPFFKDESMTIKELHQQLVGRIGENIIIKRFSRYELGE